MLLLLVLLLAALQPVSGAFVRSFSCPTDGTSAFTNFLTNASYSPESGIMRFQLRGFALTDLYDVNNATNMYTTLHFRLRYVDELILDEYLRLCDYLEVDHMTSYYVADGVFSGLENLFTHGGTLTETVTSLIQINGTTDTTTATSLVAHSSRLLNSTRSLNFTRGTDFLPVGIEKREPQPTSVPIRKDDPAAEVTQQNPVATIPESVQTVQVIIPTTVYSAQPSSTVVAPSVVSSQTSAISTGNATLISSYGNSSTCPIATNNEVILNLAADVGRRSAFGSFQLEVQIISPNYNHSVIACTRSSISTVQTRQFSSFLTAFFAIVLALIFFSNMANVFLSPYQDSKNLYMMQVSMICNAPLLNQLAPNITDFFTYMQFVFFMAALNLDYPGFYSPLVASFRWIVLLKTQGPDGMTVGNVYQTIYTGGLKSLLDASATSGMSVQWMWLLLDFLFLLCGCIVIPNILFALVCVAQQLRGDPVEASSKRGSLFYNSGIAIFCFLRLAAIPLLVVSLYIMAAHNKNPYGGPKQSEFFLSWCVVTAGFIFALHVCIAAFFIIRYIFMSKGRNMLYTKLSTMLIWSQFYSSFNVSKVPFVLIDQLDLIIFSIAVGCLQSSGVAQLVVILLTKSVYLFLFAIYKPYYSKTRMNRNKIGCVCANIIVSLLHIPFIYNFNSSESTKTRFLWTITIVHLLVIVFVFLLPTIHNLYLCAKWYYKFRKGDKGTDIPDYREDGDFIEVPFASDTRSLMSRGTFADMLTMPPLSPSVSGILRDSESGRDDSSIPGESKASHTQNRQSYQNRSTTDWMSREVDLYYDAHRILDPDPEVKEFWEERGRKLEKANDALAEKARLRREVHGIPEDGEKWDWLGSLKKVQSACRLKSRVNNHTYTGKSFEVMRPHPIMRRSDLDQSVKRNTLSTGTITLMGSSVFTKDESAAADMASFPSTAGVNDCEEDQEEIPEASEASTSVRNTLRVVNTASRDSIVTERAAEEIPEVPKESVEKTIDTTLDLTEVKSEEKNEQRSSQGLLRRRSQQGRNHRESEEMSDATT